MNWLRDKLRPWGLEYFGINRQVKHLNERIDFLYAETSTLKTELDGFKSALKAKASQSQQTKQVYTDYESSQQAVLAEFEEKNGVR